MTIWDVMYSKFKKMHYAILNAPSESSAAVLKITNDPLYQSLLFVEDSVKPRPPLSSLNNFENTAPKTTAPSTSTMWKVKSKRKITQNKQSDEMGKMQMFS